MLGQVLDEIGEGLVNRLGIKHVVVIQDEDEISSVTPTTSHVIGEQREHGLYRRVWHLQQGQCLNPEMWDKRLESGNEIREEAHQLVVSRFE
ncbi:MAG: hypothetical protein ACXVDN_14420 [Ktedonobacteraceae bacterium]